MKRSRVVPDPNQMEYAYDIKEELENDLLEKFVSGDHEIHLKKFSKHEADTLLFGLRSWGYIDIKFVSDGNTGKVLTLVDITDSGRRYAELLHRRRIFAI